MAVHTRRLLGMNSCRVRASQEVFTLSCDSEMVRVDARRIVAEMVNQHPLWDGADHRFVSEAICGDGAKEAMPALGTVSPPRPAVVDTARFDECKEPQELSVPRLHQYTHLTPREVPR